MFASQKILLRNQDKKILIVRRSGTHPTKPHEWDLPGGQVEEGENLKGQILRELREETGIEISELKVIGAESAHTNDGEYVVQIAYGGEVEYADVVLSYEHDEFKWVTPAEFVTEISNDRFRRFLEAFV
jgi:8-oxo-dGTP pyrophosphatase MutT (NUDIX family)